jgi:hypothetical protein
MITIHYLPHARPVEYAQLTFHYLNKIKPENKKKIKLNILATNDTDWSRYLDPDIQTQIIIFPFNGNYLNKVKLASQDSNPYSVKLDEDCFMSNHVWDYFIENIHILESDENLLLSPLVSTNIPLVDEFIESYITDEEVKNKLYEHFRNRLMPNDLWGVDYSSLNKNTIESDKWNPDEYYESVWKIDHYYRGIHPIRISVESQLLISDYIFNTTDRFFAKHDYSIKEFNRPYFTNNIFAFKTKDWGKILQMPNDGFDEVPLNEYKNQEKKKCFYIDNGFCMHPMYNTVFGYNPKFDIGMDNGMNKEIEIVKQFASKLT